MDRRDSGGIHDRFFNGRLRIEISENIPQCNVMINGKKSEIYHIDKLKEKDKYQVFFGGNYGVVSIENNEANNDKNLLIIKDSYANSFTPFLLKDYKTITIVDYILVEIFKVLYNLII